MFRAAIDWPESRQTLMAIFEANVLPRLLEYGIVASMWFDEEGGRDLLVGWAEDIPTDVVRHAFDSAGWHSDIEVFNGSEVGMP